jgi:hypothetical protein
VNLARREPDCFASTSGLPFWRHIQAEATSHRFSPCQHGNELPSPGRLQQPLIVPHPSRPRPGLDPRGTDFSGGIDHQLEPPLRSGQRLVGARSRRDQRQNSLGRRLNQSVHAAGRSVPEGRYAIDADLILLARKLGGFRGELVEGRNVDWLALSCAPVGLGRLFPHATKEHRDGDA